MDKSKILKTAYDITRGRTGAIYDAFDYINQFTSAKKVIVGGAVWRPILEVLAGLTNNEEHHTLCCIDILEYDIDILVIGPAPKFKSTNEIDLLKNRSQYINGGTRISIKNSGIPVDIIFAESIDSYFDGVPLNMQQIAFDIDNMCYIGPGLSIIKDEKVLVNNRDSLKRIGFSSLSYALNKLSSNYQVVTKKLRDKFYKQFKQSEEEYKKTLPPPKITKISSSYNIFTTSSAGITDWRLVNFKQEINNPEINNPNLDIQGQ